jgi:hypothetical protein
MAADIPLFPLPVTPLYGAGHGPGSRLPDVSPRAGPWGPGRAGRGRPHVGGHGDHVPVVGPPRRGHTPTASRPSLWRCAESWCRVRTKRIATTRLSIRPWQCQFKAEQFQHAICSKNVVSDGGYHALGIVR